MMLQVREKVKGGLVPCLALSMHKDIKFCSSFTRTASFALHSYHAIATYKEVIV